MIPAFTGLGPPFWKANARAAFIGINASTTKKQIVRAALESVAFQMVVYLEFLQRDNKFELKNLKVDGGMIKNKLFLQMIADLLKIEQNGTRNRRDVFVWGAALWNTATKEYF